MRIISWEKMIASITARTTITASVFAVTQAVAGGLGLYEISTAGVGPRYWVTRTYNVAT
jgi:hypothetical protein